MNPPLASEIPLVVEGALARRPCWASIGISKVACPSGRSAARPLRRIADHGSGTGGARLVTDEHTQARTLSARATISLLFLLDT